MEELNILMFIILEGCNDAEKSSDVQMPQCKHFSTKTVKRCTLKNVKLLLRKKNVKRLLHEAVFDARMIVLSGLQYST